MWKRSAFTFAAAVGISLCILSLCRLLRSKDAEGEGGDGTGQPNEDGMVYLARSIWSRPESDPTPLHTSLPMYCLTGWEAAEYLFGERSAFVGYSMN